MLTLKERCARILTEFGIRITGATLGNFYRQNRVTKTKPDLVVVGGLKNEPIHNVERVVFCRRIVSLMITGQYDILYADETTLSYDRDSRLLKVW